MEKDHLESGVNVWVALLTAFIVVSLGGLLKRLNRIILATKSVTSLNKLKRNRPALKLEQEDYSIRIAKLIDKRALEFLGRLMRLVLLGLFIFVGPLVTLWNAVYPVAGPSAATLTTTLALSVGWFVANLLEAVAKVRSFPPKSPPKGTPSSPSMLPGLSQEILRSLLFPILFICGVSLFGFSESYLMGTSVLAVGIGISLVGGGWIRAVSPQTLHHLFLSELPRDFPGHSPQQRGRWESALAPLILAQMRAHLSFSRQKKVVYAVLPLSFVLMGIWILRSPSFYWKLGLDLVSPSAGVLVWMALGLAFFESLGAFLSADLTRTANASILAEEQKLAAAFPQETSEEARALQAAMWEVAGVFAIKSGLGWGAVFIELV